MVRPELCCGKVKVWGLLAGSSAAGYLVVGLDYFEGDSMQRYVREEMDYPAWKEKKQERAKVLIPPWVEAIRKDYGKQTTGSTLFILTVVS